MIMNNELYNFIKESLGKGLSREEIYNVLLKAGWKDQAVKEGLSVFADVAFAIAVPRPKPYLQAREAFLHLVSFIALYISAFSFGSLLFEFIDKSFPDSISGDRYHDPSRLSTSLAAIIVAFPLYLLMIRYLKKSESVDPEQRESKVKKWLNYITLVIVAAVIIIDLVAVIANLLGGELTIRFILKALTVLYIAGSIFWYYLWDLQKSEKNT